MNNIKFYWEFHKSTLIINWAFSLGFSFIILSSLTIQSLIIPMTIMSMTGGPLISIFYKEITRNNEYYFYYNRGISKINLIIASLILNVLVGAILISIIHNVKFT